MHELQQRRLTAADSSYEPDMFAGRDRKRHIRQAGRLILIVGESQALNRKAS